MGIDESKKVLRLIDALRNKGEVVVMISHNLDHVFPAADRIAIMKNGAMVRVIRTVETTHDDVGAMIVSGRMPGTA
ncbi:MAG: hypothetical protein IMF05_02025 [Proteobacteria bacterium]|nr:hypothetical protein [Pseudomonadota bacterium]